ncbi:MAG: hypothetical protein FWD97_03080 [Defluviitaleaceae bacterium]|nr:hypothetical protein [Defluviitaleaceae bacterium]
MQELVKEFIEKQGWRTDAQSRYLDLVSEVGELGKEILLSTDYGKTDFSLTPSTTDEMGDCLFSLLALCTEMGINSEEALKQSISKYEAR